jgi:hypothetical protein
MNNQPTSSARFDQASSLIELACCIAITWQHDAAVGSALRLVINQADPVSNIAVQMFKTMDAVHITVQRRVAERAYSSQPVDILARLHGAHCHDPTACTESSTMAAPVPNGNSFSTLPLMENWAQQIRWPANYTSGDANVASGK